MLGCTDADEHPKPPWRKRKLAYLKHLATAPAGSPGGGRGQAAQRPGGAPRLPPPGRALWRRFTAGKKDQLWYYDELVRVLKGRGRRGPLVRELGRVVRELEQAVEEGEG